MKIQRIIVIITTIFVISGSLVFNVPNTSIAATVTETAYNAKGTIICASGLNVRKSPSTSAARLGGVSKNQVVTIVAKAGSFYKIKFGNGYGYISNDSKYIKLQTSTSTSTVKETAYNAKGTIICASGLNVRKSPSTSAARLGTVSKNQVVTIVAKAGSFYKIKYGSGYGYISNDSKYVKIQTATSTVKETAYNAKGTIICASGLNVRKSPSTSAARLGAVSKNQVVTIVAKAGSFYKIKYGNGYGYISSDSKYIKLQTSTSTSTVKETAYNAKGTIICASGLNVRKSPSTSAARLGTVSKNQVVTIVAKAGSFYKIKFGSGYGYISNDSKYVKIQTANSTVQETAYNAKGTIICASGLNVRKSPSTSAARLGAVSKNQVVTIVAKAGSFYKIKFGNGYGYISNDSKYIKLQTSTSKPAMTEQAIFKEALAFTLRWEGGYVNHKNDPGGATNKGITQGVYDTYRKQIKKPKQSVKYISNSEVEAIYYQNYWKRVKADRMDRTLAIVMFDTAVNLGVHGSPKSGGAFKHLQKAMNITADGSWGPTTERTFSKYSKSQHYSLALKVNKHTQDYRYERVKQNPSQKVFLKGWLNRDNDLRNYIMKIGR